MVSVMKDICIFMIIAQAILFFVPGDSYMKYVRVLVGIIMILRMTEPLLELIVNEEEQRQLLEHITVLEENINKNQAKLKIEDNSMGIYESIEDEIRNRLSRCQNEDYVVVAVELASAEQAQGQPVKEVEALEKIIVTVEPKGSSQNEKTNIEVKTIRVVNNKTDRNSVNQSTPALEKEELKELYGTCIGVASDRIEIVIIQG